MKKKIMPVIVLTAICVIIAALLALTNMVTAPEIAKREAEKVTESLKLVMPDGEFDTEPEPLRDGAPETVTAVYPDKNGGGHVVVLVTKKGYTGKEIGITVAINSNGKIIDAVITKNDESIIPPDLKPMGSYGNAYAGADSDSVVDVVTGATVKYTEGAIKSALYDAFVYLGYAEGSVDSTPDDTPGPAIEPAREESEIESLALALVPGARSLEKQTLPDKKPENLVRLYKLDGNLGYVAYLVVPGQYVPVATEGLVHVDTEGDIKNINLLQWVVGHDVGPGDFADGFIGKDYWHLGEVELVSGATGTSADFLAAVDDAVRFVTNLIPRTEKKLISLIDEMVANSRGFEKMEIPEDAPDTLAGLYRETGDKGYVAYIVTSGEYVAVATESLVHFDRYGKIVDVNILTWTVGHGVGPGDFAESFIGKTAKDVDSVELVAAATYTSEDLRQAISDAFPYIPKHAPVPMIIGIVSLVLMISGIAAAVVITKRRKTK